MSWREKFDGRGSALCVGLDPVPERLPDGVSLLEFCRGVVDATSEFACCYKPNLAFFERLGPDGLSILQTLVREIRGRDLPVIADAKRGDMGPTAEAYADAYFGGPFDVDALTVNPFLGLDALEPFRAAAQARDRGIFLLLRTSNPGASLFQDAAEPDLIRAIASEPAYGAVVGATDAATGARLRAALPDTLFLVPGFGAQGGADLAGFFDANGRGAVVSSSRGILYPGGGGPWKDAVRAAAREAHDAIDRARRA